MVITPETLAESVATVYRIYPDALVMGSVGRSAVFGRLLGEPMIEFNARSQNPLVAVGGVPRDVDIIVPGPLEPLPETPHPADGFSFRKPEISIGVREGEWWVWSDIYNFGERLDPVVMYPYRAKAVFGIDCLIPPTQTFLKLGGIREKDKVGNTLLERAKQLDRLNIPEELYLPIDRLNLILHKARYTKASMFYQRTVPSRMRRVLRPHLNRVVGGVVRVKNRIG